MKHIIVEGPDGAGKTTLISHLHETLGLPIHTKAAHSVNGPVDNLLKWVDADLGILRYGPAHIYDRHPVISEPIYGRIVRKNVQHPFDLLKFHQGMYTVMYHTCVVVWCLPGLDTVSLNVFTNARNQMPGVTLNIGKVYQAYETAYFHWHGLKHRYNYTRHNLNWFTDELKRMINE